MSARPAAAQETTPPPAQSSTNQQQSTNPKAMMPPDMARMMEPMWRSQGIEVRNERSGGPLRIFSRLLAAIDNPRVRMALNLSDQQADSLRKIIVDTETYTITTGASIAVDGIQLRELLRADNPDRAAVMAKGDEISKLTSQLINRYLDSMLSAKTILTPEQQRRIRAYFQNGAAGMRMPRPRP
jgi:hypothetical protein